MRNATQKIMGFDVADTNGFHDMKLLKEIILMYITYHHNFWVKNITTF